METIEYKTNSLIRNRTTTKKSGYILYIAYQSIEKFKVDREGLYDSMNKLEFHNFARANTCHMNDGVFGDFFHATQKVTYQIKVWGYLRDVTTTGYRFLKLIKRAKELEGTNEWNCIGSGIRVIGNWKKARNALEHIDEIITDEEITSNNDFYFTRSFVLRYKRRGIMNEFSFDVYNTNILIECWENIVKLLQTRANNINL